MRPAVLAAGVAAAIAIPLSIYAVASAGPVSAGAAKVKNESLRYVRTVTSQSPPLHRCVSITLTGTIKYKFLTSSKFTYWTNQKLVDPSLKTTVRQLSHGKCGARASLTAVSMGEFIDGASCRFNPVMMVTEPWRMHTYNWPGCGSDNRRQAGYILRQGGHSRSTFAITTDGTMVRFPMFTGSGLSADPPCYAIQVGGDIYKGGDSDGVDALSKKICLTKT